ncbi:MAG: hypothetical protein AAF411_07410, partial [Myxococcota bacterium]
MSGEPVSREPVSRAHVRRLLIRPGSRYRCFGDGLCCTDIHALGPIDDDEKARLAIIADGVVRHHPIVGADVLATSADGRCLFLQDEGCALHEPMGGALKPHGCQRYPVGLTATPAGARVTLEHRCPCTLLGEAPELNEAAVHEHLGGSPDKDSARANHLVDTIPTDDGEMSFEAYAQLEMPLLDSVRSGASRRALVEALGAVPFPAIEHDWDAIARGMKSVAVRDVGGRFEAALHWFGAALQSRGTPFADRPPRPWSDAFDRAEARSRADDPLEPFRRFVADHVWGLFWTATGSLRATRQELVTRLSVGYALADAFAAEGARKDRAAAEAV